MVTGGSEGFSCKASFLVELSERLVVEPVSSSETTVWVLSEAVPWIWVVSFGLQIKRKTYFVLEGICTDVRLRLFRNSHDIVLTDQDGNEHLLRIGKDYKIRPAVSYRFYFRTSESIPSGQSPLLAKAVLTDNLLGVEEIKY